MPLPLVSDISTLRISIPADLRPPDSRKAGEGCGCVHCFARPQSHRRHRPAVWAERHEWPVAMHLHMRVKPALPAPSLPFCLPASAFPPPPLPAILPACKHLPSACPRSPPSPCPTGRLRSAAHAAGPPSAPSQSIFLQAHFPLPLSPLIACAVLLTLRELSKRYPGGQLPLLDPVADMGIQDEQVRLAVYVSLWSVLRIDRWCTERGGR